MSDPDFLLLRQSIIIFLQTGRGDAHVLREGLARTEWKAIAPAQRIWALGSAAGREVPFATAQELAQRNWNELAPELRQALADRVGQWVRRD